MPNTPNATRTPTTKNDVFAASGVRSPAILEAMRSVRRDGFPTSDGLPPPDAIGRVIEAMELRRTDRVLKVPAGSGWTSAVLGHLAGEVWTVEKNAVIADAVRQHLANNATENVRVLVGECNGPEVRAHVPYDAIVLTGPVEEIPSGMLELLAPGGRLVAVVASKKGKQRIKRVRIGARGDRLTDDLGESRSIPLLGDLLVASRRVSREVVEAASSAAWERGVSLGEELLARGVCEEADLYRALAKQSGVPFTEANHILAELDLELVPKYPRTFLEHHRVIPVRERDGEVAVVTPDPTLPLWEVVQAFDSKRISVRLVTPTDYKRIWTTIDVGNGSCTGLALSTDLGSDPGVDDAQPEEVSVASGMFDAIVVDSVTERASDLHFERYESQVRVRIRVDGNLRDVNYDIEPREMAALVNIIKIGANLDISERRLPQGGRIRKRYGDRIYDMRVQTQPSLFGENVIIRLIPQDARVPTIEELGFPMALAERYRCFLGSPHGMILVVGPTGSGKSTTLYAGIHLLSLDDSRKIITIEDPIEHSMARIQQSQTHSAIGWGFADAMRAFVREDPDVILVGEIRDGETALEAVRAAQTGHLVLSTLHCNDAVDAVQRLLDLGVHPNSIGSELAAIFSQRLARRICASCRAPAKPDPSITAELFPDGIPSDFRCFVGKGCEHCGGHGTHGRIAVVEFLPVIPAIRKSISRREAIDDLRELARGSGLVSLRDSCLTLVQDGLIPLTEIQDVLTPEQMAPPASRR